MHPLAPDFDDPSADEDAAGLHELMCLRGCRERLLRQLAAVDGSTRKQLAHLDGRVPARELASASGLSERTVAAVIAERRTPA